MCVEYNCPDEMPPKLETLIKSDYPGTFLSAKKKSETLVNITKTEKKANCSQTSNESQIYFESLKKDIQKTNLNLKNQTKILVENMIEKNELNDLKKEVEKLKNEVTFLLSLSKNFSTSALWNKQNLSKIFKQSLDRLEENLFDDFVFKFQKQEVFFLSLFQNFSDLIKKQEKITLKQDQVPSKAFFNEMHVSLQELRNTSRQKQRVHLTMNHEIVEEIIRRIKPKRTTKTKTKNELNLKQSTFHLIAIIKRNFNLLEKSVQSVNHLRLLNNLYQCEYSCL